MAEFKSLCTDSHLIYDHCYQGNSLHNFLYLIDLIILSRCTFYNQKLIKSDPCPRVEALQSSYEFEQFEKEYDFIVVGGGVAGSVIAARLIENPKINVLLIEAGPEQPQTSFVPAFAFRANNTSYDWKYKTVRQKNACNSNDGVCPWPRGKMLCGTACLSGLMYTKGHRSIYDKWAENNPGWSYKELTEYFKKSEHNVQTKYPIEKEYHGFAGPLKVGNFPHLPDLGNFILNAVNELDYRIGDVNGHDAEGFTIAPVLSDDGIFLNPRMQYLDPLLDNKNLNVLLNSLVSKVIFDDKGIRAVGVEVMDMWEEFHRFKASKEVILAAGVVGSPQILMLSGVGPAVDLRKLGIRVMRNLPVGGNLHYHVGFTFNVNFQKDNSDIIDEKAMDQYMTNLSGPLSSTGITQISGFVASKFSKPGIPDIQIFMDADRGTKCRAVNNYTEVTFRPVYLLSKCRGSLKLRTSNITDSPLIDPNYLCNDEEIEALIEAEKIVFNLTQTKALKPKVLKYNSRPHEWCVHLLKNNNDKGRAYWRCVITDYTNGEHHHGGTCKMGPAHDREAVVDNELRVHGLENLRVADASIFPTPINCNPIAPIIMIGEKVSDMVKKKWNF